MTEIFTSRIAYCLYAMARGRRDHIVIEIDRRIKGHPLTWVCWTTYKLDNQEPGRENSTVRHFEIQKQISERNIVELRVK